jgi:hypothetical protein
MSMGRACGKSPFIFSYGKNLSLFGYSIGLLLDSCLIRIKDMIIRIDNPTTIIFGRDHA